MRKLFLIFGVILAATVLVDAAAENGQGSRIFPIAHITAKWVEQKLDHFNNSETRTWKMLYIVNDEFYEPGGPLFVIVGAASIRNSHISIIEGLFYDTAKEHKALLVQTDHRFYNKGKPTEDMSIENLKYLDSRQALADLAHFIRTIKSSPSLSNSSVILAGQHYSGAMVVWFKKLYPDLAIGAWAASPPLLAKLDFKEFKEATGQSIRLVGGESCYNRIANYVKENEKMLTANRTADLKRTLNLCETFDANNELDVAAFSSYIFYVFRKIVLNHNIRNKNINNFCEDIMGGSDYFKSLSQHIVNFYNNSGCNNFTYAKNVAAAKEITFGKTLDRQWFYQMCNEFGWFATTTSIQQPFGSKLPLRLYYALCKDVFGDKFTPEYMESQINKTNQLFGGLNPNVENVYITYGQLDPWRQLGIQDEKKATIIPMASNTPDLDSITDNDSKELKAAKEKFKDTIKNWLKVKNN